MRVLGLGFIRERKRTGSRDHSRRIPGESRDSEDNEVAERELHARFEADCEVDLCVWRGGMRDDGVLIKDEGLGIREYE